MFGTHDGPPGYLQIRYTVTIATSAPEVDVLRVLDEADMRYARRAFDLRMSELRHAGDRNDRVRAVSGIALDFATGRLGRHVAPAGRTFGP